MTTENLERTSCASAPAVRWNSLLVTESRQSDERRGHVPQEETAGSLGSKF